MCNAQFSSGVYRLIRLFPVLFLIVLTQGSSLLADQEDPAYIDSRGRLGAEMSQSEFWCEDFEGGWGLWYPDNGVWQVGIPTAGPGGAHSDSMCAGTILGGNYPEYANSRLISPTISLPSTPQDGILTLRFWHWFSFSASDKGYVEISVDFGEWQKISDDFRYHSGRWTQYIVDLSDTSYVGKSVRLAFHMVDVAGVGEYESYGWYIDDVCIMEGQCDPWSPETFEDGIGCWYASNGLWQAGIPSSGPGSAHEGLDCAATVLDGNYPEYTSSRLISPSVTLPGSPEDGALWLQFWHWFNFSASDHGYVEISVEGGGWEQISGNFRYHCGGWTKYIVNLSDTAYVGKSVRFAFHMVEISGVGQYESQGWYIDEVEIVEGLFAWNNPETFSEVNIDDPYNKGWYASCGVWQIGKPTAGPNHTHGGIHCAGTVLDSNYPENADSRLITPSVNLPSNPQDGALWLRFWHWFRFDGSDRGHVEISVEGGGWQVISDEFYHYGARWTPYVVDLSDTAYVGKSVQFAFRFIDVSGVGQYESYGWFVDNVEIVEGDFPWVSPETFDEDWYSPTYGGWYADRGVWEIGKPSSGLNSAAEGNFCAGTVMSSNYPEYANSRLISPRIVLPSVPMGGTVWLSFWHWYSFSASDRGYVQIRGDGGTWQTESREFRYDSGRWTNHIIDLSSYAGQTIQLGFRFIDYAGVGEYEDSGWFIDEIGIVDGPTIFNNPEGFEDGSRGWYAGAGAWEIGEPSYAPGGAYSGSNCAGTVLSGYYPEYANSCLMTPLMQLPSDPPGGTLHLRFFQWFSFDGSDYGEVRASYSGGDWEVIAGPFTHSSGIWSPYPIDITAHKGEIAQFAFCIIDIGGVGQYEAPGWYIDDVSIIGMPEGAPSAPTFNSVAYTFNPPVLNWDNPIGEFEYISIYAGTDPDFTPDLGNRIALVDATMYEDTARPGWGTYYKISAVDSLGGNWRESTTGGPIEITSVVEDNTIIPGTTKLFQNYPNPFNPVTTISFTLSKPGHVSLTIYNVAGMRVAALLDGYRKAGKHKVEFKASGLASGVYFYRLKADEIVQTKKMILLR